MSFHTSADSSSIRVDDGHILRARLQRGDGEWQDAEVDLNQFIGNENGHFQWGGQNFSESSQDIQFTVEGADNVPILRATLNNVEGGSDRRDINLAERIHNNDGNFHYA